MENQETSSDRIERAYMYKCRICGEIKQGPSGYFSIMDAYIILNELTTEYTVYRAINSVSRNDLHNCADGSLGISDLIGVMNVK